MNRKEQYAAAVRLAEELKRILDAAFGVGWISNHVDILLNDYKRAASPWLLNERDWSEDLKDLWDQLGFGRAWLDLKIAESENNKRVRDALWAIAAYLRREGKVPDFLAQRLVDDVIEDKPAKGHSTVWRDSLLGAMVGFLVAKVGINPTSNETTGLTDSACGAVAEMLEKEGVKKLGYKSIERAWNDYDGLLPLPPPDPDRKVWVRYGETWIRAEFAGDENDDRDLESILFYAL